MSVRVVVLGAAPDTGNLGVTALLYSVLAALFDHGADVVVADHGRGVRERSATFDGRERCWSAVGIVNSRRLYRPETLATQRVMARLAPGLLPATRALRDADVVLDLSGGDSFTDLYGPRRFAAMLGQKQLTLDLGTPLVLLPQTYGPFDDPRARAAAAKVVRAAAVCASRDAVSHAVLRELLGPAHDPARHVEGVDVAFALPALEPDPGQDPATRTWLAERDAGRPLAGINVSGLLADHPDRFGIELDYVEAVRAAARALVDRGADVLFIPHMAGAGPREPENFEVRAARTVAGGLGDLGRHVQVLTPGSDDPRHAKWWIGSCDWFTGPRMHATIGAVSQRVPTLATAYSMKAGGVFASAGQQDAVVELAALDHDGLVEALVTSFDRRQGVRARLERDIPRVAERARRQLDELLEAQGTGPLG